MPIGITHNSLSGVFAARHKSRAVAVQALFQSMQIVNVQPRLPENERS
jgi:hypothetical protein